MSKKYDVCARVEIDGREKPIWPKVGMTVTVKDDGKIGLYDARTGQNYFCFERKPFDKGQQQEAPKTPQTPDFNDDIPF